MIRTAGIMALAVLAIYGAMTISTVLMDRKKDELRHLTETAVSTVADYEARAARGEMTVEEAKKRAFDTMERTTSPFGTTVVFSSCTRPTGSWRDRIGPA